MTDVIIDIRPFLAVGVSLLAALLIMFSDKKPNVREAWTLIEMCIRDRLMMETLRTITPKRRSIAISVAGRITTGGMWT